MRELINHGADVNAEDAVSNYQMFVVYVNSLLVKTLCIRHMSIAIGFTEILKGNCVVFLEENKTIL